MNNDTQEFIEEIKRRPDILGIVLLGLGHEVIIARIAMLIWLSF